MQCRIYCLITPHQEPLYNIYNLCNIYDITTHAIGRFLKKILSFWTTVSWNKSRKCSIFVNLLNVIDPLASCLEEIILLIWELVAPLNTLLANYIQCWPTLYIVFNSWHIFLHFSSAMQPKETFSLWLWALCVPWFTVQHFLWWS